MGGALSAPPTPQSTVKSSDHDVTKMCWRILSKILPAYASLPTQAGFVPPDVTRIFVLVSERRSEMDASPRLPPLEDSPLTSESHRRSLCT